MSSVNGAMGNPQTVSYNASKGAIDNLTRCERLLLAGWSAVEVALFTVGMQPAPHILHQAARLHKEWWPPPQTKCFLFAGRHAQKALLDCCWSVLGCEGDPG